MATIQERNGSFRVLFCYGDKRLSFTAGRVTRTQAEAHAEKVEELLALLADGTVSLPEGVDVATFMLHKGKPPAPSPKPASHQGAAGAPDRPLWLSDFKGKYLEARSAGSMEQNSLATARMHLGHFERTLGGDFDLRKLTLADLQSHVTRRRKEGDPRRKNGARNATSAATLRLEISSLRSAWNWAARNDMVSGPFPAKGLEYPKADEQPPFMTWQEIERRIQFGGEAAELWDCLYLRKEEIEALLLYVKEHATAPWLYPMLATAAYTGARRSELLRMETADVDFEAGVVTVREKKRSRKQRTTRRVALTPALSAVLNDWLSAHPGGKYLFCQAGVVARSKKRGQTTGHNTRTR